MRIRNASYLVTAVRPDQYPEHDLPEIAMVGRSNVGKSSLINRMANQKKLAHTSGKPGKTRTINFFLVNDAFVLVDLPGYGFARVPKSVKESWARMINRYLAERPNLLTVVQLIDIRHKPTDEDRQMFEWLKQTQERIIVACTKADKISRGRWMHHMKIIRQTLEVRPEDVVLPVSSQKTDGAQALLQELDNFLQTS